MKKVIITLISILAIINSAISQDFKLIKATSQSWSGGVCCRSGINYFISLQTKNKEIIPDTVWINGNYYSLNINDKENPDQMKRDSKNNATTFTISVGETHDERDNTPDKLINKEDTQDKIIPNKIFQGAALVSYNYKNKQCYFQVKEFEVLPVISYP
jgi:hypothetical protein